MRGFLPCLALVWAGCTGDGGGVSLPGLQSEDAAVQPGASSSGGGFGASSVGGGSGGSSGAVPETGTGGDVDEDAAGDETGGSELCPPSEPFGTKVGDVVEDVVLKDCAGSDVSWHELCDRKAAFVFLYAGWCPPCQVVAKDVAEQRWAALKDDDFGFFFVVTANAAFGPPSAGDCQKAVLDFGLTMPVLYDPTGAIMEALELPSDNDQSLVFAEGMTLKLVSKYADQADVQAVIDTLLK